MEKTPSAFASSAEKIEILGRRPIIYDETVTVRFGDMDAYGHVNASNYLDYVGSARVKVLEKKMGKTIAEISKLGLGFFLKKATQQFKRPISALIDVRCVSYVQHIEKAYFTVSYSLEDAHGKVFSTGTLEYVTVDIKTGGPVDPPDWTLGLFLHPITQ